MSAPKYVKVPESLATVASDTPDITGRVKVVDVHEGEEGVPPKLSPLRPIEPLMVPANALGAIASATPSAIRESVNFFIVTSSRRLVVVRVPSG
jgi:hypothetical protein